MPSVWLPTHEETYAQYNAARYSLSVLHYLQTQSRREPSVVSASIASIRLKFP